MKKNLWLLLLGGVLFASCQKEKITPLNDTKTHTSSSVADVQLLNQEQLAAYLNLDLSGYSPAGAAFSQENSATQLTRTYRNSKGQIVNISLADMGNWAAGAKQFILSGRSYNLFSSQTQHPTALLLASNTQFGYEISQFTGMGATQMALYTGINNTPGYGMFEAQQLALDNTSFARATTLDTGYDIPGWEVYDSKTGTGAVILLVNSRFALVIDGTHQTSDIGTLLSLANGINYSGLVNQGA